MKKTNEKVKTPAHIVSTVISRIFDPFLVLAAMTGWMVWQSTLSDTAKYIFVGIVLCVMIIPPILLLIWAISKKHIDNWDISDRKQRPLALTILFMLGFINIIIVQAFGDRMLTEYFIMFQLWMAGFMAITFLWKISGHTGTLALALGLLVVRLGFEWWPILILVFILAAARIIRKNHTPAQAIAGILYSWGILYIAHGLGLV